MHWLRGANRASGSATSSQETVTKMTSKNPSPFLRDRRSGLCARRRAAVIILTICDCSVVFVASLFAAVSSHSCACFMAQWCSSLRIGSVFLLRCSVYTHIRKGCPSQCFGRFCVRNRFRDFWHPFTFMFAFRRRGYPLHLVVSRLFSFFNVRWCEGIIGGGDEERGDS